VQETAIRRWSGDLDDRIPTGISEIDQMTGGMGRRELWIIAARPSMGKSALMLHMAKNMRSLIFSLEMPVNQILNRMVAAEAGVPYSVATSQVGDVKQREAWLAASERVGRLPMMFNDSPGMTTARIQGIASRAIAENGVNAIFIDHLNYISDHFKSTNEQEKTGEVVRRCKHLADMLDVPVVLLSQLNREAESRQGCMPYMSDLRSSGRIEEDAHFVGLLYRRAYYSERSMVDPKPELDFVHATNWQNVQLIVAKNRNGETGTAFLGWEAKSMRFHDLGERRIA
jgi:replicative DNA helicase